MWFLPEVTLTTAETAAAEGVALEFTLHRTGPAEEALGVDVSVSETGAMLAVSLSRAVIPAGQDDATFPIPTVDDEAVEADSVVTVSIAEDEERYTLGEPSTAAVTVADDDGSAIDEDDEPLTARFEAAPGEHDGTSPFTFELHFSAEVDLSYRTLRDHAFTVTGGQVRIARRLANSSNRQWEITVEPATRGDVDRDVAGGPGLRRARRDLHGCGRAALQHAGAERCGSGVGAGTGARPGAGTGRGAGAVDGVVRGGPGRARRVGLVHLPGGVQRADRE